MKRLPSTSNAEEIKFKKELGERDYVTELRFHESSETIDKVLKER